MPERLACPCHGLVELLFRRARIGQRDQQQRVLGQDLKGRLGMRDASVKFAKVDGSLGRDVVHGREQGRGREGAQELFREGVLRKQVGLFEQCPEGPALGLALGLVQHGEARVIFAEKGGINDLGRGGIDERNQRHQGDPQGYR